MALTAALSQFVVVLTCLLLNCGTGSFFASFCTASPASLRHCCRGANTSGISQSVSPHKPRKCNRIRQNSAGSCPVFSICKRVQGKRLYCWKSLKPNPVSLSLPNLPLAVLMGVLHPSTWLPLLELLLPRTRTAAVHR